MANGCEGQLQLGVKYPSIEAYRSSRMGKVSHLARSQTGRHAEPPGLAAAEFFAGIGLVRAALEEHQIDVVFANDIEPFKHRVYAENFGDDDFVLGDVCEIVGGDIPPADIATASFPCTDLSLAGGRAGLSGENSGMFWEFARVIEEMEVRPRVIVLENVPGFATSRQGKDLRNAIARLNGLGYKCDLMAIDARRFVPQSRQRLFVVGFAGVLGGDDDPNPSDLRPQWLIDFVEQNRDLELHLRRMPALPACTTSFGDIVERMTAADVRWWDVERTDGFLASLSATQAERLAQMRTRRKRNWATAYRRTRNGVAVWEIRGDGISGCLRTAAGGSSRQAVVEAGNGNVRVRWMTPREYARLQGADNFILDGVSENQARSGFGDAVCVPAVSWLIEHSVKPLLLSDGSPREGDRVAYV